MGTQSWAVYWLAYTLFLVVCGGEGSIFLFWFPMLIPAVVIIIATTIQAATLSECIYVQRSSATIATTSPVGREQSRTSFPWIKHLCLLTAAVAIIAAAFGISVLVLRPKTPPLRWSAEKRVNALLTEANAPMSWIERTFNVFPYRREQGEIKADLEAVGEPAVEPLIKSLDDPNLNGGLFPGEARAYAIDVLGLLGDSRAVEPLTRMLKAREPLVRACSAWALGQMGDARAVPALSEALKDPDWNVSDTAKDALGKLGPSGRAALDREGL